MTHNNLVLSEKAIKNHCKRLKKELLLYNPDISLGETQELFSKILGFNNFHSLQKIIHNEDNFIHPFDELTENFSNKTKNNFFVVFIKPVNNIHIEIQKKLKDYLYHMKIDWQKQNIFINHTMINEQFCSFYLDPKSDFAHILSKNSGLTVDGALDFLARDVSDFLNNHGFDLFYNIEYGYLIHNNQSSCIHFQDLISERY